MKGLSNKKRDSIKKVVDGLFDKVIHSFLGKSPRSKKIYFASEPKEKTLAHLYVMGLQKKDANLKEKNLAKNLLKTALSYVEALQKRTESNIIDKIDSLHKEAYVKKQPVKEEVVLSAINKEMDKAKRHFKLIAETESTKIRNTSVATNILGVAESIGVDDPNVFFLVVKDGSTCKHCINNHLMPDGVTPKVFKMSEVKTGYLSKEDREEGSVSLAGQHPHCRCSIQICSPGFGFKNGKISWIGLGHDEYKAQRG